MAVNKNEIEIQNEIIQHILLSAVVAIDIYIYKSVYMQNKHIIQTYTDIFGLHAYTTHVYAIA